MPNRQGMREAKSSSRSSGKKRMRCTSPVWRGGYTTDRIGGAGKSLSKIDAGGEAVKRKTRSSGWPGEDKSRLQSKATEKVL